MHLRDVPLHQRVHVLRGAGHELTRRQRPQDGAADGDGQHGRDAWPAMRSLSGQEDRGGDRQQAGGKPPARQRGGREHEASGKAALPLLLERDREREDQHAGQRQERRLGRGLVQAHDDAERGQHQEDGDVREHPAVVARARFAAEGKGDWLGFGTSREPVRGVPDAPGGQREPQHGRQARGIHRAEQPAEEPNQQCADPERQGPFLRQRLTNDARQEPFGHPPLRHRPHHPEGRGVLEAPWIAAEETGHHVGHQQREQHPARQLGRRSLRDAGGRRSVFETHECLCGCLIDPLVRASNEKGSRSCLCRGGGPFHAYLRRAFAALAWAAAALTASVLAANFWRNFSTRPVSTIRVWAPV